MKLKSFSPLNPPKTEELYPEYFESKDVLLIKLKNGCAKIGYYCYYADEDTFAWKESGRDGYEIDLNLILSWAYIPEFEPISN